MAGSITPLPVMLDEEDRKIYERLEPPKSIVVRYGYQKLVAELPYDGEAKPGCGSKLVISTDRGIELGTMLTTTCPNSGCSKSVSRKEMLQYIDNSGGKHYPFTTKGKILRVATIEDLNEQSRLDARKPGIIKATRAAVAEAGLPMRLVDVELLLGGERIIFYYTAEQWVDFRELVKTLAAEHQTRIEMHQVNEREEARLVADYERCGQYCCCKNFLKVLKPVSMRSAKVQKATLDPQKISGRCGRLMCCLRYEDETYEELRKKLPHRKSAVETEDGIGEVQDSQILTQLVLVRIPGQPGAAAYPLENIRLLDKEEAKAWRQEQKEKAEQQAEAFRARMERKARGSSRAAAPAKEAPPQAQAQTTTPDTGAGADGSPPSTEGEAEGGRRRRRRRSGEPRRPKPGQPLADGDVESKEGTDAADITTGDAASPDGAVSKGYANASDGDASAASEGEGGKKPRRRRRRRRRGGRGRGGDGNGSGGDGAA